MTVRPTGIKQIDWPLHLRRDGSLSSSASSTLYLEMDMNGHVHIYEMTEENLIAKIGVETRASFLAPPETIEQAHDYLYANAYHLEMFETLAHAETWAADYNGFRAGEVRAELRRYRQRRDSFFATLGPVGNVPASLAERSMAR
jgi:hypothetical protein